MALSIQNRNMNGAVFNRGFDITADLLTISQQYLATAIQYRSRDFIKYPGFAWGMRIAAVTGKSITITKGTGYDQEGVRLNHLSTTAYQIEMPDTGDREGWLCARAWSEDVLFQVHPYDGTRHATETVVGVEFYIDVDRYVDAVGNYYPSDNSGIIIAKITVAGTSYTWDDTSTGNRSPILTMQDGN